MRRFPLFALMSGSGRVDCGPRLDGDGGRLGSGADGVAGQPDLRSGVHDLGQHRHHGQPFGPAPAAELRSWAKYKSGTTASDGAYSFTANTTEPTRTFRVHAAPSGGNPAVDSEPLTVTTVPPPPGEVGPRPVRSPAHSPRARRRIRVGSVVSITANFPNGTFPITLYVEGPADT